MVDDDMLARIEMRLLLEMNGYQVEEVSDGMEAIGMLDVDAPRLDLVVLDSEMTLLNWLETLHSLRALQPGLKAMVCLARESSGRLDILPEGAIGLRKPCTLASMSEALDQLFGAHRHLLDHGRVSQSHKVKLSGHRPHYPPR